jgi:hypothetical protein
MDTEIISAINNVNFYRNRGDVIVLYYLIFIVLLIFKLAMGKFGI